MCVRVGGGEGGEMGIREQLRESAFPLHCMGPGDGTQVVRQSGQQVP